MSIKLELTGMRVIFGAAASPRFPLLEEHGAKPFEVLASTSRRYVTSTCPLLTSKVIVDPEYFEIMQYILVEPWSGNSPPFVLASLLTQA